MRRLPIVAFLFTVLFLVLGLTSNVLSTQPTFSNEAFAQQQNRVVKKSIKKKIDVKKVGGKNNGLPKKVRELESGLSALQTQLNTIELTPGPQGENGPTRPARS